LDVAATARSRVVARSFVYGLADLTATPRGDRMPKQKTRKTVAKRFKITGTGKLMRRSTGMNHLMRKKTNSQKRVLTKGTELFKGDKSRIVRMLAGIN
jgi:large subunit ribosomal protein L35